MKLLMTDRPVSAALPQDAAAVDLSALRIANCVGCFGCWTKTPGRCVIRDDAARVYPLIARSEQVLYVSQMCIRDRGAGGGRGRFRSAQRFHRRSHPL